MAALYILSAIAKKSYETTICSADTVGWTKHISHALNFNYLLTGTEKLKTRPCRIDLATARPRFNIFA